MSKVARKSGSLFARVGLAAATGLAMLLGGCGPTAVLYGPWQCGANPPRSCVSNVDCVRCAGTGWYCEKADGGTQGICKQ